jgi:hypothetical protein
MKWSISNLWGELGSRLGWVWMEKEGKKVLLWENGGTIVLGTLRAV